MNWETVLRVLRDKRTIAAVLAVLAVFGVTITVVDDDGDGRPESVGVKIERAPFDGPDADSRADDGVIKAPEQAVENADARVEEGADRKDPADLPPAVDRAIERNKRTLDPLPLGGAFQSVPGCRTRLLAGDSSSRNGVRPVWLTWHYAVIPNKPGFADLDILFNVFASPSRDASSHFGLDAEGNCIYMVPIERKAWTAVNANSFSISVEIIAMGNESVLCPSACMAQARRIAEFVKSKTGIPIARGAVSSSNLCAPGRAGQITHDDHKGCGGAHIDIRPFSIDAFTKALAAGTTQVLSDKELKIVQSIRKPAGTGHSKRYWCRRLAAQLFWLNKSPKVARQEARLRILKRVWRVSCA